MIDIAGIAIRNPVMTASGTFGYGDEYSDFVDLDRLGAVVVKGITARPCSGNQMDRIYETASGMLNAIGLQNVGVDSFLSDKLPYLRRFDVPVIVNICGGCVDDYVAVADKLDGVDGVDGIELNVSCPNIDRGGQSFGVDPILTGGLVSSVRRRTSLPLIVKLSPNVTDIGEIARAAECSGADGVSAINTVMGMAIDINTTRPRLANVTGGLSGSAIKPIAVRMVWQLYNTVKIPIIGMGGIMTGDDAVEFLIAGASAVAVGTASFINPRACLDVADGIASYLERRGLCSVSELVGSLEV